MQNVIQCNKCGTQGEWATRYVEPFHGIAPKEEHLSHTCLSCGYVFTTPCWDALQERIKPNVEHSD
jgi:uncharacterized Zn finger protein